MKRKEIDLDGRKIIIEEVPQKGDEKPLRILRSERKYPEPIKVKCENCGHINDFVRLNELLSKCKQLDNEAELAIKARKYGKVSRIYHQASELSHEMVDITSKADYICKKCNRFSANLYIVLKNVKSRIKSSKDFLREDEKKRLEYLGLVFDYTFQVYPISGREQNTLDYISGKYLYEHSDFYKKTEERKTLLSEDVTGEDFWLYREAETFSFDYDKLTFIFTGEFTSEIKKWLIEETTHFIERLFSLDIINYETLCSDISCEAEFEKLVSYIQILEDFLLFSFAFGVIKIDRVLNNFFQKATFQ